MKSRLQNLGGPDLICGEISIREQYVSCKMKIPLLESEFPDL